MGPLATTTPALEPCRAPQAVPLLDAFVTTRRLSEHLAAPLSAEDQTIQSMPDASPTKWHLAHTTWFFETFVLLPGLRGYRPFDACYAFLFNSYYEALGSRHPRPQRGLLSRPSGTEIAAYRAHVDAHVRMLLAACRGIPEPSVASLVELGIHHEQQHQELMLTDILHLFSLNPLRPAYRPRPALAATAAATATEATAVTETMAASRWHTFAGGTVRIGHSGDGFCFDNETPRHAVALRPFRLAAGPVTNGQWRAFIADGGYHRPEFWLADGWAIVQADGWQAPLYWQPHDDGCAENMTPNGVVALDDAAPVCHISYYEADAFARWAGKRLPLEAEWETAASGVTPIGNTLGTSLATGILQPRHAADAPSGRDHPRQLFGDVWEWTASPYVAYPGFRAAEGAVGEYNGKFMCNQFVLRGGSCVTPDGHIRATYRNFFYPHQRWQFTGLRLAEDG